jgi:hypothetical protein
MRAVTIHRAGCIWILAMLGVACGGGDDGGFDFNSGTGGSGIGPMGDGSGTTSAVTGSESSDGSADSVDPGTDGSGSTGAESGEDDTEDLPSVPCTSLDVVFVVDDSDTMAEEQMRLQAAAAAWIDQLNAQIPTVVDDVRIGVITTEDSGFVQADGAGTACAFASAAPWMTLGPSLATELPCALAQGVAGDPDERPMDMLQAALSDEALSPGGMHDGFLRDEGLLVVVLLTDEEDDLEQPTQWGSAGDPPDWVDAIAAKKGGYAQNVVVVSLVGHDKPNACPAFQWDGMEGAEIAPRLIEFTESFPQGAVGDICAPEYSTFLMSIVPGVAAACDQYVP